MKLVVIIPYFYPRIGGLENYALKICEGLLKKGWKITVITSNQNGNEEVRDTVKNIEVIRLGTTFRASNTPVGLSWSKRIHELLIEIKPDLVNAHTPVPFISDLGISEAKKLGLPSVLTYQNDIFKDNIIFRFISFLYYSLLGNRTLSLSDKIIITSKHYGEISDKLRPYSSKLEVIPPGVNVSPLINKKKEEPQYILFVGQLDTTHRHKGLNYLIESMKILKSKSLNVNLVVIGKGDDLDRYKKLVEEANLKDNVSFKGFVADKDMPSYYANALCLCLPSTSQSEGFGMVIIEAASQMTPSIGSKVGGIPSVILDGKTGLLVNPRDSRSLSDALEYLIKNNSEAKKMGSEAYKRVINDFTWEKQIEKTDNLFRSISS